MQCQSEKSILENGYKFKKFAGEKATVASLNSAVDSAGKCMKALDSCMVAGKAWLKSEQESSSSLTAAPKTSAA